FLAVLAVHYQDFAPARLLVQPLVVFHPDNRRVERKRTRDQVIQLRQNGRRRHEVPRFHFQSIRPCARHHRHPGVEPTPIRAATVRERSPRLYSEALPRRRNRLRHHNKSCACIGGAYFSLPRPLAGAFFHAFSRLRLRLTQPQLQSEPLPDGRGSACGPHMPPTCVPAAAAPRRTPAPARGRKSETAESPECCSRRWGPGCRSGCYTRTATPTNSAARGIAARSAGSR